MYGACAAEVVSRGCENPSVSAFLREWSNFRPHPVSEYVNVDGIPRYDPYEDTVIGDAAQLSGRRRSELKRLETNGWTREKVEAVSSKRRRFVYVGPDGATVTSLKNAMKEISLCAVVDTAEQDALYAL